ncbi:hypothetical protein K6U26_18595 [Vibrio parahaemolyticus]|nr:hypothetical protein [Vibrio parahaemolyticus]MCG6486343.1 hypothetical protein [Vibrio parahaemolyticus]
MKSVILSTLGLIVVTSSPIAAANTLDREEWSSDLRQDFSEMKHEAVADIQKMNTDAIDARDRSGGRGDEGGGGRGGKGEGGQRRSEQVISSEGGQARELK